MREREIHWKLILPKLIFIFHDVSLLFLPTFQILLFFILFYLYPYLYNFSPDTTCAMGTASTPLDKQSFLSFQESSLYPIAHAFSNVTSEGPSDFSSAYFWEHVGMHDEFASHITSLSSTAATSSTPQNRINPHSTSEFSIPLSNPFSATGYSLRDIYRSIASSTDLSNLSNPSRVSVGVLGFTILEPTKSNRDKSIYLTCRNVLPGFHVTAGESTSTPTSPPRLVFKNNGMFRVLAPSFAIFPAGSKIPQQVLEARDEFPVTTSVATPPVFTVTDTATALQVQISPYPPTADLLPAVRLTFPTLRAGVLGTDRRSFAAQKPWAGERTSVLFEFVPLTVGLLKNDVFVIGPLPKGFMVYNNTDSVST